MPQIDLTFVHAPATYDFRRRSLMYGLPGDLAPSTPLLERYPLGIIGVGGYLERHGIHVRLYNLAGMMMRKKAFDVGCEIAKIETKAFALDMQWTMQCQGVCAVARVLKDAHPDIPVIVIGSAATVFHEELVAQDAIDYVVRGDSCEEPLCMLMTRIKRAVRVKSLMGDLSEVPNLTWIDEAGSLRINALSHVPDDLNTVSVDYAYPMQSVWRHASLRSAMVRKGWMRYPSSAVRASRGCSRNCAICECSAYACRHHLNRGKPSWRSPLLLAGDVIDAGAHVSGPVWMLGDILSSPEGYLGDFLGRVKGAFGHVLGVNVRELPVDADRAFALLDRCLDGWALEISPETHDDALRAAFGKGGYTTDDLESFVTAALSHEKCRGIEVNFEVGIPCQTASSVRDTVSYAEQLLDVCGLDRRIATAITPHGPFLEAGSMAFDDPQAYGYRLRAKSLEEHCLRALLPSWKHIMSFESLTLPPDEMADVAYEAAIANMRALSHTGAVERRYAVRADVRILRSREQMKRLDSLLCDSDGPIMETVMRMRGEVARQSGDHIRYSADGNVAVMPTEGMRFAAGRDFVRHRAAGPLQVQDAFEDERHPYLRARQQPGTEAVAWVYEGVQLVAVRGEDAGHALAGSLNAAGFEPDAQNDTVDAAICGQVPGFAGVDPRVGRSPAVTDAALGTAVGDALLLRIAEEEAPSAGAPYSSEQHRSLSAEVVARAVQSLTTALHAVSGPLQQEEDDTLEETEPTGSLPLIRAARPGIARLSPSRQSADRIDAFYTSIAGDYDSFSHAVTRGRKRGWIKRLVLAAHAGPQAEALDIACGTGDAAFELARQAAPASIIGIDSNEEMLAVARRRLQEGEADGAVVRFCVADARHLPFADNSFDVVMCSFGVRVVPDRVRVLQEAYRVLKPNGRFAVLECATPSRPHLRRRNHIYLEVTVPQKGRKITGEQDGFDGFVDAIRTFPNQETFDQILLDTGFREARHDDMNGGIVAVHVAVK